jgi:streptogramin lyase
MAAGPDGNVWFFDVGQNLVGRVTPTGTIQEFAVPGTGAGSEAIAAGQDGNLWMVARADANGWILKVSPTGVVTQFPVPAGAVPEGITWGPDSNVWFTEVVAGRIGRMTPSGAVTEFPIPTPDSSPRGIVTGPDQNLWFVESTWHRAAIARMTTAGEITEYPLGGSPTDQLQPHNIVTGPDRNLWFSEIGRIGRITTAGEITQFPVGPSAPAGLAAGPDGNLWFTDQNDNSVGRISPTGVIRQFPLPRRNAGPTAIAPGSDGRIWFTETNVNRIGSIGVTVPETTLNTPVLNFGFATTSTVRTLGVTNTGDGPLHIMAATVAGPDHASFSVTTDTCSGHIVAVQSRCNIEVAFQPQGAVGFAAALLQLADNASGSPQAVSLIAQMPDCRLPLFSSAASPSVSHGEFLSLRDGTVVEDPTAGFTTEGTQSQSQTSPVIYGQLPASFDRIAGRWVPASDRAISSDGMRYAYIDYSVPFDRQLHVVDIASGGDRTLALPSGPWGLLAFTNEGIYLHAAYEGISPGLTLVNPDSGAVRTVFTDSVVSLVSGQVAWISARNDADPLPPPPGIGGSYNEVQSRDLITSQTTTWFYRPGSDLYVMGAANGSIVVSGRDSDLSYLWVVSSQGQADALTVPGTGDLLPYSGGLIADANGWWLGSLDGVYLWTPRTGAVLVSEALAAPVGQCA